MISRLRSVSRETLLLPVHAWRLISRTILPPRCKYHPSCSQYCLDAVRQRGVLSGGVLAIWRLLRCNPWSLGGVDPVPTSGFQSSARRERAQQSPESTN
jgi:putative membrane protein insertion efficiency factor